MEINNLHASPLVASAKQARRPTRWWIAYPFSVITFMIIGGAVQAVATRFVTFSETSVTAQIVEAFTFGATFLAIALWVRFKEGRSVRSLGFLGSGALPRLALGIVIGAGMLTLAVVVLILLGQYHQAPAPAGATVGWPALLPFLLLAVQWLIQSSTEETISRGYQIQVGALQLPGWLALLIPGLIHALHLVLVVVLLAIGIVYQARELRSGRAIFGLPQRVSETH